MKASERLREIAGDPHMTCTVAKEPLRSLADEVEEMEGALRDLLDSHFDMSPLEYAASRGLPSMTDAVGDEIVTRARRALKEDPS